MKKTSGMSCSDIEGECDKSVGLYCQGRQNSKTCSYAFLYFFMLEILMRKLIHIFNSCFSGQYFDTHDKLPQCSWSHFFWLNIKIFIY
jgi:hypothetical protein